MSFSTDNFQFGKLLSWKHLNHQKLTGKKLGLWRCGQYISLNYYSQSCTSPSSREECFELFSAWMGTELYFVFPQFSALGFTLKLCLNLLLRNLKMQESKNSPGAEIICLGLQQNKWIKPQTLVVQLWRLTGLDHGITGVVDFWSASSWAVDKCFCQRLCMVFLLYTPEPKHPLLAMLLSVLH